MSSNMLVILGAGGHAKVCYEIAIEMKVWNEIIILDDNPQNEFFEIVGGFKETKKYPLADFFVAIGDNDTRKRILTKTLNESHSIATLIHPNAIISPSVTLGIGSVIMAGVIINANTVIQRGCILNTACTVDHDSIIQSYVHISPGANLAGHVEIGEMTWIGIGSSISNNVYITTETNIGAGSVVINDILNSGTYVGSPAIKID